MSAKTGGRGGLKLLLKFGILHSSISDWKIVNWKKWFAVVKGFFSVRPGFIYDPRQELLTLRYNHSHQYNELILMILFKTFNITS